MTTNVQQHASSKPATGRGGTAVCIASAVLAAATFPVIGNSLRPVPGVDTTALFADAAGRLQLASVLGVLASAGLFLAAARLAQQVPGIGGKVAGLAGGAVALMLGIYVAVFSAGSIVAGQMLEAPGPGVGEAALVALNMADLARYAPSLALVVTVVLCRRHLPKSVVVTAGVLAVMFLVPMTSWIAAILTPVWLGLAGAGVLVRRS